MIDRDPVKGLRKTGTNMSDERQGPDAPSETLLSDGANGERPRPEVEKRAERETTPTQTEKSLTPGEREAVAENGRLSALTVYSIILREGEEELQRPKTSLWWSGVAAGIGISTSVLAEGVIRSSLPVGSPYVPVIESLGYTFGFVLVIMCRLQLFTENTITVVLPLLATPTWNRLYCTARLWAIVFTANMFGTFLTSALAIHGGILPHEILAPILDISRHVADIPPTDAFLRGIPAGFLIAAVVWMLPSAEGAQVIIIMLFTWLIAAGGFTHVIAGSNEVFNMVMIGDMTILTAFTHHIFPILMGNIIGGTGLFAMLAYGQVSKEM